MGGMRRLGSNTKMGEQKRNDAWTGTIYSNRVSSAAAKAVPNLEKRSCGHVSDIIAQGRSAVSTACITLPVSFRPAVATSRPWCVTSDASRRIRMSSSVRLLEILLIMHDLQVHELSRGSRLACSYIVMVVRPMTSLTRIAFRPVQQHATCQRRRAVD